MTTEKKLREEHTIKVFSQYAKKLKRSKTILTTLFPLTEESFKSLTLEQDDDVEACIGRFCKLQDYIGAKLFPMLIDIFVPPALPTEPRTFIDQLNLLEKYNIISSRQDWEVLRNIRNKLAHDYPDESDHVEQLNNAYAAIDPLLDFWGYIEKRIPKELLPK